MRGGSKEGNEIRKSRNKVKDMKLKKEKALYPCNRPWRPVRL
jgi:hypothetical protein